MTNVMIGVDPHNGSPTATMLDRTEGELRRITVRSIRRQLDAAGKTVLDVPATLASSVRVERMGAAEVPLSVDGRSIAVGVRSC